MASKRRRYAPEFKAKVALEAAKGEKTLSQLTNEYGVASVQISQWKRQLLEGMPAVFGRKQEEGDAEALTAPLYQEIVRLKMELDWLKKSCAFRLRRNDDASSQSIPRERTASVYALGLARSSWYAEATTESTENLSLMRLINEQYLHPPILWQSADGRAASNPSLAAAAKPLGIRSTLSRLPTRCGISASRIVHCGGDLCTWSAIIDWYSRYVLMNPINTLDTAFCLTALDHALAQPQPTIFNTDQGSQFTNQDFTDRPQARQIRISMDGTGRVLDNVFVERLWRSIKYECLYLRDFDTVFELRQGLTEYFTFYNHQRLHQALSYRTPHAVHFA